MVRRAVLSGWAAASRHDWDLMLVRFAPDVEIELESEFAALLGGPFHGRRGLLEMNQAISEAWEGRQLIPAFIFDLGDRMLMLGTAHLLGTSSGLELDREYAELSTLRDGLIAHDRFFTRWDTAVRAVGLDPNTVALPRDKNA
jgi:ketosteroid isomerase-like protein